MWIGSVQAEATPNIEKPNRSVLESEGCPGERPGLTTLFIVARDEHDGVWRVGVDRVRVTADAGKVPELEAGAWHEGCSASDGEFFEEVLGG